MTSERNEEQLQGRIAKVIDGYLSMSDGGMELLNEIMEEIKGDFVILPADEYQDIREMCRLAMHVASYAREWAASESE